MKPGCLWIGVSRLNSLMSNEVQALIKVFPLHQGIHNNTLIWGSSEALVRDELTPLPLLPQWLSLGGFSPPHQAAYTKPTTFGHNSVEKTQKYHRQTHAEAQGSRFPRNPAAKSLPETFQPTLLHARWALEPFAQEGNADVAGSRTEPF